MIRALTGQIPATVNHQKLARSDNATPFVQPRSSGPSSDTSVTPDALGAKTRSIESGNRHLLQKRFKQQGSAWLEEMLTHRSTAHLRAYNQWPSHGTKPSPRFNRALRAEDNRFGLGLVSGKPLR